MAVRPNSLLLIRALNQRAVLRLPCQCRRMADAAQVDAGSHQTPVVDALWKRRMEAKQKAAEQMDIARGSFTTFRELVSRRPEESRHEFTYEFSKPENAVLVEKYSNPWGTFRFGRLLEDLDALAGTIAYDHCKSNNPNDPDLHIVTASVDRIRYRRRPLLQEDVTLSGSVTWVGRSSMEIKMEMHIQGSKEVSLESYFTFVARCAATGKATQINPLKVDGNEEHQKLFEQGRARDAARKKVRAAAKASSLGIALDQDGMAAAADLLNHSKVLDTMPSLAEPSEVLLPETALQNTLTAMPQHRNTAGRIFGGFLMRRAFELAHSTAYLFSGTRPVFHELDEVTFKSPVAIGDLLRLDSCVLFTSENFDPQGRPGRPTIHIEVIAKVLKPEVRDAVTSNTFNFTFGIPEDATGGTKALRRVLPVTSSEAYRILLRYRSDLVQKEEDNGTPWVK